MNTQTANHTHLDLTSLLETSRILVESHDQEFIINNLLLISMGKIMARRAMVILQDPVGSEHTVYKVKGKLPVQKNNTITIAKELINFSNKKSSHTSLNHKLFPKYLREMGISWMFNIRTNDRHFGFLCIGGKLNDNLLSVAEKEFLESLVLISSVAIENSQLVEKIKEANKDLEIKVQQMNTLFEISKEFNVAIERDQILRIFKFSLIGQMFIRTFVFISKNEMDNGVITSLGVTKNPTLKERDELFADERSVFFVDDLLRKKNNYLKINDIELVIRFKAYDGQPVCLGLGKRGGQQSYNKHDINFLISLGNLVLLTLQKAYLLQEQLEKKRIEEELVLARSIQKKLLPDRIPAFNGINVAAINIPSEQIGGDYYDVMVANNNLYLAIADVSGKGTPASLLMANLQAILRVLIPLNLDLKEATDQINSIMCENTASDKFVSFFWGKYDYFNKKFHYVNAGHNPPFLIKKNSNRVEELDKGGVLLGVMPTSYSYEEGCVEFDEGDLLILYTDGVTEALSVASDEFTESRLKKWLLANRDLDAEQLLSSTISDLRNFCNNHLNDDVTLMVVKGTSVVYPNISF